MPFPYGKIIAGAIGRWRTRQCRFPTAKLSLGRSGDGGHGSAVSLRQNYRWGDRDITINNTPMEETARRRCPTKMSDTARHRCPTNGIFTNV